MKRKNIIRIQFENTSYLTKFLTKFILCLILTNNALSQNQYNHWHFGDYASLEFIGSTPIAKINSAMKQEEGCASISHAKTGQLLFYTNGIKVYDKNNLQMPNGFGLLGDNSAAQSASIIPHPGDTNKYFIVTTSNYFNNGTPGLHYSIVDMTANGGLGDVIQKNSFLLNDVSEKQSVVHQSNNKDYWLIAHSFGGSMFYIYPITSAGFGTQITSIQMPFWLAIHSIGCMRISPEGSRLAVARSTSNTIDIYAFNRQTGNFSGLLYSLYPIDSTFGLVYDVAFSPDASKLYVTNNDEPYVYQFDLTAGNSAAILSTKTIVGIANLSTTYFQSMGMQLGPNKKLYIVSDGLSFVAEISNPNLLGSACGYNASAVQLSVGDYSNLGLPNCIETAFTKCIKYSSHCLGDSTNFNTYDTTNTITAFWNFGDPNSLNNTDTGLTAMHYYSTSGIYTVTQILISQNSVVDTIIQQINITPIPSVQLPNDTTICIGDSLIITAIVSNGNYIWNTGASTSSITTQLAGSYIITVDDNGCKTTDTVNVSTIPCGSPPIPNLASSDSIFCEKNAIDFYDLSTNNPTSWQWTFAGANPGSSTLQNPTGIYYPAYGSFPVTLVACNSAGCDSVTFTNFITELSKPPPPSTTVNGSYMCCNNVAVWYQWYYNNVAIPNANSMCYTALQPGNYYVLITDSNGCNSGSGQILVASQNETNVVPYFNAWYDAASGNVNVVIDKSKNEKVTITIYDVLGQTVKQITEENSEGNKINIIPAQFITKGIYMIEVSTKQKTCACKLLIH